MYFDRLIDFVYVESMKMLLKDFVPKRCANCGKWFLQRPGATYAYCKRITPGEMEKTCRDIGATVSFHSKVKTTPSGEYTSMLTKSISPGLQKVP